MQQLQTWKLHRKVGEIDLLGFSWKLYSSSFITAFGGHWLEKNVVVKEFFFCLKYAMVTSVF